MRNPLTLSLRPKKGGTAIVGRAVFLDYVACGAPNNVARYFMSSHAIIILKLGKMAEDCDMVAFMKR